MNNLELINKINKYSVDNNEYGLVKILNDLINDSDYKKYIQEIFSLISITEMYGFLSYLSNSEIDSFLKWDSARSQTYKGNNIDFYNKGQLSLLYDFEKNKKVFLSAPTSFGKTSIVLEYILWNFKTLNNILFIVPTNSLLEELYQKMLNLNKKICIPYYVSTQPYLKENKKNFLLLTPERFFFVSENISINSFDLIVMDETYKIVGSKNESVFDFLESRSLRFRKVADMVGQSNNRVIFLSPFTYILSDSMNRFLKKYEIIKIDRKLEYVNREIKKVIMSSDFKTIFHSNIAYNSSFSMAKKTCALLEQLKNEKNIVYVSKYSEAYKIVEGISFHNELKHGERFNKFIKHLEINYDVGVKYEWKVITALKKGIGVYVSPIPRYIKKEIIKLYESNEINTLIVTSAFTEGVNTSACNLIFTSLVNGPNTNKLSDIDVLNVSGRAGRFSKNNIGIVYCISNDVYLKVNELQNNGCIKLENYNYKIESTSKDSSVKDYIVEMKDDEYLTNDELILKSQIDEMREKLNLSKSDLNISLCVPVKWKLILYKAINNTNICGLYDACKNILADESNKRIESLESIFSFIKNAFVQTDIDPFFFKDYEIKAFDNSNNFIWGRLYKIYCSGQSKDIIKKNIVFVSNEFKMITKKIKIDVKTKKDLVPLFIKESKKWVLDYYTNDLKLDYDKFYTETFKFISNIIQYKIPFYTSFAASIVKLYIIKNNLLNLLNIENLDSKKITLLFENGNINEEYNLLIDFGLSNDLLMKLYNNKISYSDVITMNFNYELFDDYELIILKEFAEVMK